VNALENEKLVNMFRQQNRECRQMKGDQKNVNFMFHLRVLIFYACYIL